MAIDKASSERMKKVWAERRARKIMAEENKLVDVGNVPAEPEGETVPYFCRRLIRINGVEYAGQVKVPVDVARTLAYIDDKSDWEKGRAAQDETHTVSALKKGNAEVVL